MQEYGAGQLVLVVPVEQTTGRLSIMYGTAEPQTATAEYSIE